MTAIFQEVQRHRKIRRRAIAALMRVNIVILESSLSDDYNFLILKAFFIRLLHSASIWIFYESSIFLCRPSQTNFTASR